MLYRISMCAIATASLLIAAAKVGAFDDAKYPDLSGQWLAVRLPVGGQPAYDPTKPWGLRQEAPLTPQYQAVLEASLADQANGGQGNWPPGVTCLPAGIPAMMTLYNPMEIIVTPEITYILIDQASDLKRRIYTDGRGWPTEVEPSFQGYSIGRWIDEDGDGQFDVLEFETRYLKGPRALGPDGMPTHPDGKSIIKERFYFNKADPKILHDEITLIDNAYTRPWTVLKTYTRSQDKYPIWTELGCQADNALIKIRDQTYYKDADGHLMPTRKDQPPPDLKYFNQSQK
jgi:hypothetical protein